jgi:hypothetical protein
MTTNQTPTTSPDALLSSIQQLREHYQPPPPKRGKQRDFSALSFLLLAAVAVTLRTFRDSELHRLLEKDAQLRKLWAFRASRIASPSTTAGGTDRRS